MAVALLVSVAPTPAIGYPAGPVGAAALAPAQDDIDEFMERVLSRRIKNWEDLYRYTVRDTESFEVRDPLGLPIESYRGEYVWYVRDGYMIRSPQTINGVKVGEEQRRKFEDRFIKRVKRDEERARKKAEEAEAEGEDAEAATPEAMEREYFLGFPFEPGNYFLAGREQIDGMDLLKIEYYPEKLFEDDEERDDEEERDPQEEAEDQEWIRRFQKTSRVTLWVLPEEHQIVQISFDNVGLEFLPLRWLVQVEDVSATLKMEKLPDEGVWLPRSIRAHGAATVALGTFEVGYRLDYFDYKKTDVQARVRYSLPEQDQSQELEQDQEQQR
jgi:hypothetical protein